MEAELFAFTAAGADAQRHYQGTIERPVPVTEISRLDGTIGAELSAAGHEAIRCWGSIPGTGNLRSWKRMQPGHWALLYVGGGEFPLLLRVAHKARSRTLAEHLWQQDPDGKTWELMFFLDLAQPVDLGIDEVRASLGYEGDWWPQGLQYPTPEHQETLLEKFGSLEAFATSSAAGNTGDLNGTAPSAEELLLGGAFAGAPTSPPKLPKQRKEPDPDIAGRGYVAHEQTVEKLAQHVGPSFRKGTPGINHDGAWTSHGAFFISEVKSINSRNEVGQLQKGLGQILHNRFKAESHGIDNVSAYLIAEREPTNSELWRELCERHGVVFTWPERFDSDIEKPSAG